jgi:hypothetical protein
MEQDPKTAVQGIDPAELDQVPEHLEDPEPEAATPAAKPGGPLRSARMTGSSIAARDAAGWVTDFLNAGYYRRPVAERDVDDIPITPQSSAASLRCAGAAWAGRRSRYRSRRGRSRDGRSSPGAM